MSPLDSSYLPLVCEAMEENGFHEFTSITIDKDKDRIPYHLRSNVGRNTGKFFFSQHHCLLVQLNYNEDDCLNLEHILGYWQLRLHLHFKSEQDLMSLEPDRGKIPFLNPTYKNGDKKWIEHFRLIQKEEKVPGNLYCRYDQSPWHGETILPVALAETIKRATDPVLKFLKPSPFVGLNTTNFPPVGVFPGCEDLFWKKFGLVRFIRSNTAPDMGLALAKSA